MASVNPNLEFRAIRVERFDIGRYRIAPDTQYGLPILTCNATSSLAEDLSAVPEQAYQVIYSLLHNEEIWQGWSLYAVGKSSLNTHGPKGICFVVCKEESSKQSTATNTETTPVYIDTTKTARPQPSTAPVYPATSSYAPHSNPKIQARTEQLLPEPINFSQLPRKQSGSPAFYEAPFRTPSTTMATTASTANCHQCATANDLPKEQANDMADDDLGSANLRYHATLPGTTQGGAARGIFGRSPKY